MYTDVHCSETAYALGDTLRGKNAILPIMPPLLLGKIQSRGKFLQTEPFIRAEG